MGMIGSVAAAADSEIATLHQQPAKAFEFFNAATRKMDVDKAWHAMHFLLNGDAWDGHPPLDFWTLGGVRLGDAEEGIRAFTSVEVKAIAEALAPFDTTRLFERWDADAMDKAEIYGVDPFAREDEEEYVGDYFASLKQFIENLARDGQGMLVSVS